MPVSVAGVVPFATPSTVIPAPEGVEETAIDPVAGGTATSDTARGGCLTCSHRDRLSQGLVTGKGEHDAVCYPE